jgi:hypothetical protein
MFVPGSNELMFAIARREQALLYQVIGTVDVAAERYGESAQVKRCEHRITYGWAPAISANPAAGVVQATGPHDAIRDGVLLAGILLAEGPLPRPERPPQLASRSFVCPVQLLTLREPIRNLSNCVIANALQDAAELPLIFTAQASSGSSHRGVSSACPLSSEQGSASPD